MFFIDKALLSECLPINENNALAVLAKDSSEKMEEFIFRNLGLAVKTASEIGLKVNDDVIQTGIIGLINAVKHYDPNRGGISTCARYWIRNEYFTYLKNEDPIHYSHSFEREKRNYERLSESFERIGANKGSRTYDSLMEANGFSKSRIDHLKTHSYTVGSYDDGSMDIEVASFENDVLDLVYKEQMKKDCEEAISKLTALEKETIERVCGLHGDPETLSDIAREKNVSRQAVGNLKSYAIKKLRKDKKLKGYAGELSI